MSLDIITPANTGDLPELIDFMQSAYADTYPNDQGIRRDMFEGNEACREALRGYLGKRLADPSGIVLLDRVDENIVGCAGARATKGDVSSVEVYGFYVDKSVQGRGVGRQLFTALMKTEVIALADDAWLYVARDCQRAKTFYDNEGFTVTGEEDWDWPYWLDEHPHNQYWKMAKPLH